MKIYLFILLVFLFQSLNATCFLTLIEKSLSIIEIHSKIYKIDESHNHLHSKEVLYYTNEIIKDEPLLSNDEANILILSTLFHDVIDSKYISFSTNQKKKLLKNYLSEFSISEDIFNQIWFIINNISYSKTIKYDKNFEPFYETPNSIKFYKYKNIFNIVRNADLLSSYNLKRSFQYNNFKLSDQQKNNDIIDIYHEVFSLYKRRMNKLRDNNILSLKNNRINEISFHLEQSCLEKLNSYNLLSYKDTVNYFDMYPKNIDIKKISKNLQNKTIFN